jgi:hypothetical protein
VVARAIPKSGALQQPAQALSTFISPRRAHREQALPIGSPLTGQVIGRQPFGVFLTIDCDPDAVGLAEIITMPREAALPQIGERVHGEVIDHADHNCQVRIRLEGREAGT